MTDISGSTVGKPISTLQDDMSLLAISHRFDMLCS